MMSKISSLISAARTVLWQRHRNLTIVGAIVFIGIIIGIASLLNMRSHPGTVNTSQKKIPPSIAVIEITPTGFLPSTISVSPNTKVVWVNEDVNPHLPAADPYPDHSSLPSLVAPRALGIKETYSFLVTKVGTIQYHDDLKPTLTGTIEIK
jgi:plastocyanin